MDLLSTINNKKDCLGILTCQRSLTLQRRLNRGLMIEKIKTISFLNGS